MNLGVDIVVATPGRLLDLMEQGYVKLGAIKMSIDGAGQSAWNLDRPDVTGAIRIPEEALYAVGKRAHDLGWQLGIHAIGDAATEMTVRVLDLERAVSHLDDCRIGLVERSEAHVVLDPEKTFGAVLSLTVAGIPGDPREG